MTQHPAEFDSYGDVPHPTNWGSPESIDDVVKPLEELEVVCDRLNARMPILIEISNERARQDAKFAEQNHPSTDADLPDRTPEMAESDRRYFREDEASAKALNAHAVSTGTLTWSDILHEEVAEAIAARTPEAMRAELVQVAAVAVAWIECLDRRAIQKNLADSAPATFDGDDLRKLLDEGRKAAGGD